MPFFRNYPASAFAVRVGWLPCCSVLNYFSRLAFGCLAASCYFRFQELGEIGLSSYQPRRLSFQRPINKGKSIALG